MKGLIIIAILLLSTSAAYAQRTNELDQFELISSLPVNFDYYKIPQKIRSNYKLNDSVNPFYLIGDFKGDRKDEFAVLITEIGSGDSYILFTDGKTYFDILGDDPIEGDWKMNNVVDQGTWKLYPKETKVERGVGEKKELQLIGDAILCVKYESSSWIIYWDGRQYRTYWQGD